MLLKVLLAFVLTFFAIQPSFATRSTDYALLFYDANLDRVVLDKNSNNQIVAGAFAKVMSLYVILQEVRSGNVSLDSIVTVSRSSASQFGANVGLKSGDHVKVANLISAMLMLSANDAAYSLAELVGKGDVCYFVSKMNKLARSVGMNMSNFVNPTGLNGYYCSGGSVKYRIESKPFSVVDFGKSVSVVTLRDVVKLVLEINKEFPSLLKFLQKGRLFINGVEYVSLGYLKNRFDGVRFVSGVGGELDDELVVLVKNGKINIVATAYGGTETKGGFLILKMLDNFFNESFEMMGFDQIVLKKNSSGVCYLNSDIAIFANLFWKTGGGYVFPRNVFNSRVVTGAISSAKVFFEFDL